MKRGYWGAQHTYGMKRNAGANRDMQGIAHCAIQRGHQQLLQCQLQHYGKAGPALDCTPNNFTLCLIWQAMAPATPALVLGSSCLGDYGAQRGTWKPRAGASSQSHCNARAVGSRR